MTDYSVFSDEELKKEYKKCENEIAELNNLQMAIKIARIVAR